ncbi:MAG: hypothetical protein MN733_05365 [Nitrososphaera sp.]|nr:hypothetical protein [Nitrososphaera sp.]
MKETAYITIHEAMASLTRLADSKDIPTHGLRRSWVEWGEMAERHFPVDVPFRTVESAARQAKYGPPLDMGYPSSKLTPRALGD